MSGYLLDNHEGMILRIHSPNVIYDVAFAKNSQSQKGVMSSH